MIFFILFKPVEIWALVYVENCFFHGNNCLKTYWNDVFALKGSLLPPGVALTVGERGDGPGHHFFRGSKIIIFT